MKDQHLEGQDLGQLWGSREQELLGNLFRSYVMGWWPSHYFLSLKIKFPRWKLSCRPTLWPEHLDHVLSRQESGHRILKGKLKSWDDWRVGNGCWPDNRNTGSPQTISICCPSWDPKSLRYTWRLILGVQDIICWACPPSTSALWT